MTALTQARATAPSRRRLLSEQTVTAALFLLPALLFLGVFIVWPIINSIQLSFFEWNGLDATKTFVGLNNWRTLAGDPVFWHALQNNATIVVLSIVIQMPVAMGLAVLIHRGGRGSRLFKSVYFIPFLMSTVAVGVLFKYIYDPAFGVVTPLLQAIGLGSLAQDWLGDPGVALFSVVMVICWQFIPFYMILFLAQLTSIPAELHEAAAIDGASQRQYFFSVELPMMRGILSTAAIISLIGSLKYFDLVWVMTEGGPTHATELMATDMYKEAFSSFKMGYGSTIATAVFAIVMLAALTAQAVMRRRRGEV